MTSIFLFPGELACDLAGIPADSDHRMILRMFTNTLVWSIVGTGAAIYLLV